MELQFCQYFPLPIHVVDQHLHRIESILVLKQPSCNVFQVRNECWRLFWTSKQSEWYWQIRRICFTARASQVNVNTIKRMSERRSEMQLAKCLIVQVLSSSSNVYRLDLRNKKKATQQWSLFVANDIVLNQICAYFERVYAYNVISKFWFVRSFSSQHYSKFITNKTSENVSQILLKNARPDPSFAR